MIRKPIITVLGHVDAGKSSLLDRIRGTDIVAKEAGGITQHIGATEVPIRIITKLSSELMKKYKFNLSIPGLLFIDTPGHEAFVNLRKRGGSIADLAVLVIDINQGCQPQTYEAIDILRTYKTPFIVAANKIDRVPGWRSSQTSFTASLDAQHPNALEQLDIKLYELVGQLHSKGFNSERFDRCDDFTKQVPIIPTCSRTGEGLPEILLFLAGLSQKFLEKNLNIEVSGPGKGTVLEVTEDKGLGKTINVILYDGTLKVGQEIALGGKNGIIKAKIRALLEPKPLSEIKASQEKFGSINEVHAASGVKIAAPGLDDALAGSQLRVLESGNETKEILDDMKSLEFESDASGPIVKADALGSLEAMVNLLSAKGVKVRRADVGEVSRADVMEAHAVQESNPKSGVIFSFNAKISSDADAEARKRNVNIFKGNVIYQILEEYDKWMNAEQEKDKQEKLEKIVLPAKIKILPNCIFRNTKPAIVGVRVLTGKLRSGTKLINSEGKEIGSLDAIQQEGKDLQEAPEGKEIAVSINGAVCGRNLFENDVLYTYIPQKQLENISSYGDVLEDRDFELIEEIKKIQLKKKEE
jgi:translation initiation factor 5B